VASGVEPMACAAALDALDYLMRRELSSAAVMQTDWAILLQQFKAGAPSLLSALAGANPVKPRRQRAGENPRLLRQSLRRAAEADLRGTMLEVVRRQVTDVLGANDLVDVSTRLTEFGLDSLSAVTLANRLEASLGVPVPLAKLVQVQGIEALVDQLLLAVRGALSAPAHAARSTSYATS
jgi:acyl carrier protein